MKADSGALDANILENVNNSGLELAPAGDRRNVHDKLFCLAPFNPRRCKHRSCDRTKCLSDRMRGRLH